MELAILEPKANEIWLTKSGNLALIVAAPDCAIGSLAMVWYDKIDHTFTVSELLERLDKKMDHTASQLISILLGETV